MFYTLSHPAPVYDCEDFSHQADFMAQASGKRELVFFPETAWWLGFDNNLPLVLPLTGWSRMHDIQETLPNYEVDGHVTFTSGREWGYWQYDHYLTRVTWDREVTWDNYLAWMEPVYGAAGTAIHEALSSWTALQKKHFYDENPLVYFYLAGELKQDEIGAQAGILARRPKIAFKTVLNFTEEELAAWQKTDFDMLARMLGEYEASYAPVADLSDVIAGLDSMQARRVREMTRGLSVYLLRLRHAIELYSGVLEAREGNNDAAYGKLANARIISAQAVQIFEEAEDDYRYPVELLARAKPKSKTSYPFGYLEQTSSGHFWTRRDDQLEILLDTVFGLAEDGWAEEPQAVYYTDAEHLVMTQPEDPLAAAVLGGFIPRLLFGVGPIAYGPGTLVLQFAEDYNTNGLPDIDTEQAIGGSISGEHWQATTDSLSLKVFDDAGAEIGTLVMLEAEFDLALDLETEIPAFLNGDLTGEVDSAELIALIMSVGGIDPEGAGNLLKSVYGLPADEPLPERLPFGFHMELLPV
jgi:hypothetical protein